MTRMRRDLVESFNGEVTTILILKNVLGTTGVYKWYENASCSESDGNGSEGKVPKWNVQ